MAQAKEILREIGCASEQPDITTVEGKALGDYVKEKYGSDFVFVTEWPWESRPFYHKKAIDAHGQEISVSADLLYKGVVGITNDQRINIPVPRSIMLDAVKERCQMAPF